MNNKTGRLYRNISCYSMRTVIVRPVFVHIKYIFKIGKYGIISGKIGRYWHNFGQNR